MFFCLWVCVVCHSINITDAVSYQAAAEGDAGEQQPGGESMEAEESWTFCTCDKKPTS